MSIQTFVIIIFSLFLGNYIIAYYKVIYKKSNKNNFWKFKTFLGLGLIISFVVFALVVINLKGDLDLEDPLKRIEFGENNNDISLIIDGCKQVIEKEPTHIDCHFKLAKHLMYHHSSKDLDEYIGRLKTMEFSGNKKEVDISNLMVGVLNNYSSRPLDDVFLNRVNNDSLKYLNYMFGLFYIKSNDLDKAITFLKKEIEVNGYRKGAVNELYNLYLYTDESDKVRNLVYDEKTRPFVPNYIKREIYYKDASVWNYVSTILERSYDKFSFVGFFAALLIAFIWMSFLRQFDIYQPERWRNLIFIFILGSIFTFLVYPISDFLEISFNLEMKGNFYDDLIYSSIVIGFVEELVKILPFLLLLKFFKFIDEPYDYILYASSSALGFAFMENMIYFEDYQFHVIFIRTVYSVVGHMFWSSIIAYGFIMVSFRNKHWLHSLYYIPMSFAIASLGHGLFDVLLFYELLNLNTIFFFFSLLAFIYMINNALNISNHYNYGIRLKREKIAFQLIMGLISVYVLQYFIIGWEYGNVHANNMALVNLPYGLLMITFLVILFSTIHIKRGEWKTINVFSFIPNLSLIGLGRFGGIVKKKQSNNLTFVGKRLRFFTPKQNLYLGWQLPVIGKIKEKRTVSGEFNWYLIEMVKPLNVRNCLAFKVLVRPKDGNKTIIEDKIELEFLMFPKAELLEESITNKNDLFPIERVYSICISR